jgi:hypothetical protein
MTFPNIIVNITIINIIPNIIMWMNIIAIEYLIDSSIMDKIHSSLSTFYP